MALALGGGVSHQSRRAARALPFLMAIATASNATKHSWPSWYILQERGSIDPWHCTASPGSRYEKYLAELSTVPFELEELRMPNNSHVLFFGTSLISQILRLTPHRRPLGGLSGGGFKTSLP